ncbi:MAG: hypothetical protein HQK89_08085 [Nitrospirae bacterium]|nr:hypothetical protein [Nitrospirota bacterium]
MESDKIFHDWLIVYLQRFLSKEYTGIAINLQGQEKNEFSGHYPDMILKSYGMVMAVMEVETEGSITPGQAARWKSLTGQGAKLMLMVPERSKAKVMNLLWELGIAADVAVGGYELKVSMP